MKYAVEVFDGRSGKDQEFESLKDAKKCFESEKEYYKENGYKYEFIELNSYDENDRLIETIMSDLEGR